MTREKFLKDIKVLASFAQYYCAGNHAPSPKSETGFRLVYRGESYDEELKICLCAECRELFLYAHERLQACPHEEKPRCRACKNPCYERTYWKKMAKMMRYSGMRLGFLKLKEKLKATLD